MNNTQILSSQTSSLFLKNLPSQPRVPPHRRFLMLDENARQSLPLVQPLLGLLSSDGDVPYQLVTRALSAVLAPLPFEALKNIGLYPVIQQGLHSKIPDIQLLALEQAQKMTEVDDLMVYSLLDCLGDEDAMVGKKAVEVITTVSRHFFSEGL